jgi:ferredoxin
MPIKKCQLENKDGFKWGDSGKCYTHENTPKSIKEAKKKVIQQAVASGEIFKDQKIKSINE